MKRQLVILSTLAVLVFGGCSKYAGEPTTKNFAVEESYTAIEVSNAIAVTISDAVSEITVTAGENIMPNVVVEVKDNTLILKMKPWHSNRGSDITAIVPYNAELKAVRLSGASEFHSSHAVAGEQVKVRLSGASDFYADVEAEEVEIRLSGSSNFCGDVTANSAVVDLSGSSNIAGHVEVATTLELEMSGASDAAIDGQTDRLAVDFSGASTLKEQVIRQENSSRYAFECTECTGALSGASDAYIHCDGSISVTLSGASELHYTGNATTRGCSLSGGSNLVHD